MPGHIFNIYPVHFSGCFSVQSGCGFVCVWVRFYVHGQISNNYIPRPLQWLFGSTIMSWICGWVGVSVCMIKLQVCTQSTSVVVWFCDQVVDLCVCVSVCMIKLLV